MTDVVSKPVLVAAAILAVAAGGFLYWQFYLAPPPVVPPIQRQVAFYTSKSVYASLGEDIYRKSQNPVEDRVPEPPSPNINPIEGAYKNPFD